MDPPEEEGAALLKPQVAVAFSLEVEESNKKKGRCGEGIRTSLRHMLLGTRVNMLLPFIPAAVAADAMNLGKAWTFSFTLLAIIPLAERLGFVTEQLAMHTNSTVGGLMNATFGNATEMIVAVFALKEGLLRVVQMSLLGSILSNMLLVLGSAFFLGGCVVRVQRFNQTAALVNAGLLLMALMGMLLPAVLYATHTELRDGTSELFLSRFSSVVMLIAYGAYLFFQLKSHRELYSEKPDVSHCSGRAVGEQMLERGAQLDAFENGHPAALNGHMAELQPLDGHVEDLRSLNGHGEKDSRRQTPRSSHHGSDVSNPIQNPILNPGLNSNCPLCCPHGKPLPNPDPYDVIGMAAASGDVSKEEEEEEEESVLGFWGSVVWLALITVLIAVLSDRLVATLQGAAQALNVSVAFISVIVLPIVGNAAEHASAVLFAYRNRLDITLGVAIGSSTQIAMFVTPFCVVLGWVLGQPLDLNFHLFETATLFIAVLVVVFLLQDGTSNWLKGLLLVFCYLIIGASFFVHRDEIAPVRSMDNSGWPSPEH